MISRKSPDSDEFEDIENLTTPDAVSQIQLDRVPSGFTYAVRVSATNAIGTSELSDPCEPFTVKKRTRGGRMVVAERTCHPLFSSLLLSRHVTHRLGCYGVPSAVAS